MDHHHHNNSSWSAGPPPYHDNGGHFNHHRRYPNNYQPPFSHGPTEHFEEEKCIKLYVCNIPREITEEDIRAVFGEYGTIVEVILFKQIKTLQQKDGCFVKYAKIEEASQAIKALHNQYKFPGRLYPVEVKFAAKKPERPSPSPGFLRPQSNKVFVGFLNKHASQMEIAEIFLPYGLVEEVFVILDEQRRSRGMGFITFSDKAMAIDAINGLNGKYTMQGCDHPLVVRFADPKKPKHGENRNVPYFRDPMAQTSLPNSSQMFPVSNTCSEMEDQPDCEWSEHICPDGNAYYYNCETRESLWEKPDEYSFYEQELESFNQRFNPTWVS